jgi:hypothetical protein
MHFKWYQKKYAKNVSKIILTGGGVLLKGFTDLAKISFQTRLSEENIRWLGKWANYTSCCQRLPVR